ncbi:MAG: hypothetical protein H7288_12735 [Kineosporiaceae bacterium]|nr:hypothetical protein [Aeromicrobium sp.]
MDEYVPTISSDADPPAGSRGAPDLGQELVAHLEGTVTAVLDLDRIAASRRAHSTRPTAAFITLFS